MTRFVSIEKLLVLKFLEGWTHFFAHQLLETRCKPIHIHIDKQSAKIKNNMVYGLLHGLSIKRPHLRAAFARGPCWARTSDPLIMSQML